MKKVLSISLFSFIFILFFFPASSFAASEEGKVIFAQEGLEEKISQETINYLLDQAEGDDITIHNVFEPEDVDVEQEELLIQPNAIWHKYSILNRKFKSRSAYAAKQYATVAYGKTITLTETVTLANNVAITGGYPVGSGGTIKGTFGKSKTRSISKGTTLTGPDKGYSSRMYYLTAFRDSGTFTLVEKNAFTGKETNRWSKTYGVPSSQDPFVDWSRDIK